MSNNSFVGGRHNADNVMSDKDNLVALLKEFGVGLREEKTAKGIEIVCEQGAEKIVGYGGFVTVFKFSEDGKFLEMGAWE